MCHGTMRAVENCTFRRPLRGSCAAMWNQSSSCFISASSSSKVLGLQASLGRSSGRCWTFLDLLSWPRLLVLIGCLLHCFTALCLWLACSSLPLNVIARMLFSGRMLVWHRMIYLQRRLDCDWLDCLECMPVCGTEDFKGIALAAPDLALGWLERYHLSLSNYGSSSQLGPSTMQPNEKTTHCHYTIMTLLPQQRDCGTSRPYCALMTQQAEQLSQSQTIIVWDNPLGPL